MPRKPFIGRFHNGYLEIHPGEIASMNTFITGFYERDVTIWCREFLRSTQPKLMVDVGANFGYYPILFGLLSDGQCEAIALEPDPVNAAWLERNLALNPSLRIAIVKAAAGDHDGGSVSFELSKQNHNLWSRVGGIASAGNEHANGNVYVPTVTVDAELDRRGVAEIPLTLIDVEGYEAKVIEGMSAGIARRRYRNVVVEYHSWAIADPVLGIREIVARFENAGYTGLRFQPHGDEATDKSRDYYRLDVSKAAPRPISYSGLTKWEHFLFSVESK